VNDQFYSIISSLYFANSGLKTRLNLLNTGQAWWTLFVLILLASTAKIVPVTVATKICTRKPWNYCASMGVLMNTRGIVQLVVLNIGVQLKVIAPVIFAMFVLMATVLTIITSPVLYLLYQRNSDPKTLEESKTAYDLHLALEGEKSLESQIKVPSESDGVTCLSVSSSDHHSSPKNMSNDKSVQSMMHKDAQRRKSSHMTLF
jgi:hypothetical protein